MKPTRPVLCLGELLIDMIVSDGATSLEEASAFEARPGGAPANVAVALARLGVLSAFCGAVGDDPFGQRLRAVLASNRVQTDNLAMIEGESTTLAFAWKDKGGDGHFRILRMADTRLSVELVEQADIANCAAIVVGSVVLTAEGSRRAIGRAVELAGEAGVPVYFDINIRPTLWSSPDDALVACAPVLAGANLVKLSLDDAAYLFGVRDPDAVFAHVALREHTVLLTGGAQGAWFCNEADMVEHVASYPIDLVEPTGAGDAFTAAIVSRLLESDRSIDRDDVAFASAAGAITATRVGAIESLPTIQEIEHFLSGR